MYLHLTKPLQIYFTIWVLSAASAAYEYDKNNGVTVTITDLKLDVNLTISEWRTITGTDMIPDNYAVVNVRFEAHTRYHDAITVKINSKKISDNLLVLNLIPNKKIVDSHFVALIRQTNHSRAISNEILNLNCYYQSNGVYLAALEVCRGLRGVIFINAHDYYIVNPLPERYVSDLLNVPHVLIKKRVSQYDDDDKIDFKARRRKRMSPFWQYQKPSKVDNSKLACGNSYLNKYVKPAEHSYHRYKRNTSAPIADVSPAQTSEIYVETAVFVDKDLYQHMTTTFPVNTEQELIRFILALINAVHLLYHDPSLGWMINFVLKRLEILHADPSGLVRVHDIDKFLSSFCTWQRLENPPSDDDPLHWDHAVILTGLDLYVLSKNGKMSNQVVGLAPIAGMCTATSSCTVNEGRHFESAYVVAHEIGHNFGMRHDGQSADNNCDPSSYLMSPTLGSGKITWSTCSKQYLQRFLESKQSRCLFDKSSTSLLLDHGANGILPGQRFDVHQQCKLKYGSSSHHSAAQSLEDVCKDLQCSRDHYLWTSHPALEGTMCGNNKWCRSGRCIEKGLTALEAGYAPHQIVNGGWSGWSPYSECASSCLHGDNGLSSGSIGIMVASRRCNNPRPENGGEMCSGNDQKYKTCSALQCQKLDKVSIIDFSNDVCFRASEVDAELIGTGEQRISSDADEACKVWCHKRDGGYKTRSWTYPDGTVCQMRKLRKSTYCIRGSCKEFTCTKSSTDVIFAHSDEFCPILNTISRDKRREAPFTHWFPASECFYNCITPGSGIRLVEKKSCPTCNVTMNVQMCQYTQKCSGIKSILEYATAVCNKFSQRVRRLSGVGMQLSAIADDPHRPCRLACQDETINHRFYLVNGEEGWFPFGTDCTKGDINRKAFCISGKCLEFGQENIPIYQFEYSLPLMGRWKRQLMHPETQVSAYHDPSIIDVIKDMIHYLKHGYHTTEQHQISKFSIDLQNPIYDVKQD